MGDEDWWHGLVKLAPRPATDDKLEQCHMERSIARIASTQNAAQLSAISFLPTLKDSSFLPSPSARFSKPAKPSPTSVRIDNVSFSAL
jgi:hypothetical protein